MTKEIEKLTLAELKSKRPDLIAAIEKESKSTGKKELEDLSGPWNPDLTYDDLSKEFIIKLIGIWQYAWITLHGMWYQEVRHDFGFEAANKCEAGAWRNMAKKVNPRYAKVANIQLNTVLDSLKALQLPLDNTMKGKNADLYHSEYEVINENKVHVTITRCAALEGLERNWPERIVPMCQLLEKELFEAYALNPRFEAVLLKAPPRKSKDEIACEWMFQLKPEANAKK